MSTKKILAREKRLKEEALIEKKKAVLEKCAAFACEKFGSETFDKMKQDNKGLHFLPLMTDAGEVQKMALMKLSDSRIEKLCQLAYIRTAMRECFIAGDKDIFQDDQLFTKAADTWIKILEGKKMTC